MLFVAFPLLLLILFLCIYFLIVWLICVLVCFSLDLSCMGISALTGLSCYFLSHIREVFQYNLLKYFLSPFHFLFFFWQPYNSNVGTFNIVQEVSESVLNYFSFFFLYSALQYLFPLFYFLGHLSVLLPQLFCYWFLLENF